MNLMYWKWGIRMQISVVKPNQEIVDKLSDVMDIVYDVYGVQLLNSYAVMDDGELGFVFLGEEMNIYVNRRKEGLAFFAFLLDEEGKITYYGVDDYRIMFSQNSMDVVDKNNKQYSLYMTGLSEGLESETTFSSYLNFWQYNPDNDTACDIQYAQKIKHTGKRETNVYVDEVENVFIDPRYSVKGGINKGLVSNGKKYYSRVTCETIDIGDMSTEESSKYLPIKYISPSNRYYTLGMLSSKYDYSDIAKVIESYGMVSSIPRKLLDIYCEADFDFRKVQWIVREVLEERKKETDEKGMVFKLVPDEEDKN